MGLWEHLYLDTHIFWNPNVLVTHTQNIQNTLPSNILDILDLIFQPRMADVQRLAHRALSPWLQHVARRPMPRGVPKGAPEFGEVPRGPWMAQPKTAEALGKLHGLNGEATFEERLSEPGTRMDELLIQVFCLIFYCFYVLFLFSMF